ncbi:MAG: rod shape-determining protein MreD [Calditrichaeota bacterium]|nr:rod shape-determining protein MreD [Calditrichota bacterium]
MTNSGFLIFFILSFLLQIGLVPFLEIKGIKPDLLLIFVIIFSLQRERFWGTLVGFFVGLIQDFFSTGFLGVFALAKTFSAFLVQTISEGSFEKGGAYFGGLVFTISLFHDFLVNWISVWGTGTSLVSVIIRSVIPGAVYTTVVAVIVYELLPKGFFRQHDY